MLTELASHNDDIRRLLDIGYALGVDEGYLVVRDVPYLDSSGALQTGAIVAKLIYVDKVRVQQDNHQIWFAGSMPHGLDGKPIPNLGAASASLPLKESDLVVQYRFSNKPLGSVGFSDFFEKIKNYTQILSGPAIERHGATPYTFRMYQERTSDSVFKFQDTLTSRAEIGDLAELFKNEVIAIIGLGGTGSYILDFFVKTPVKEIRGFDGDPYHVHNAFRSPGRLEEDELGKTKAEVYERRYDDFRHGLMLCPKYIDASSRDDLDGVTFAFVCVDKGSARSRIFDLLMELRIPFIDVGMGLKRKQGMLSGMLRVTYYGGHDAATMRSMQLAEMVDDPDDIYKTNIQISELNALNACLAVIRYKQIRGFYGDENASYHMLMEVEALRTLTEKMS